MGMFDKWFGGKHDYPPLPADNEAMAKLDEMKIQMVPIYDDGNQKSRCCGVHVSLENPRGDTFRREYSASLFSDVASRAVTELISEGILQLGDEYHYELIVDEDTSFEITLMARQA